MKKILLLVTPALSCLLIYPVTLAQLVKIKPVHVQRSLNMLLSSHTFKSTAEDPFQISH